MSGPAHPLAFSPRILHPSTAFRLLAATFILALSTAASHNASGASGEPASPTTGLVYSEAYLRHDTGPGHPESPERLKAIVARLEATGLMQRLRRLDPSPAPLGWITTVHSEAYVAEVERTCQAGTLFLHSPDTPVCARSYDTALLAAGGVLGAIDAVMSGEVKNAFCAVRPPGHHALRERAMGFCIFNNVAIGTRYVQRKHGLRKVLIVDWDVHHGNGTQAAFYDDPTVLYFSVHRSPFYPGTGAETERGSGAGEGYTVNVALPAGSGDDDYVGALEARLESKALRFKPDFVLISAGFDAHRSDPLGGMQVTTRGYAAMTHLVMDIAEQCCSGRVVSVLEGGYDLEALSESVKSHLLALLGQS